MAKDFAKAFYKSKAWKACRRAYIDKRIGIDGGLCEECQTELGYIVHHKIVLTAQNIADPDITLNHRHLAFVCKDCHDREEAHAFVKEKKLLCAFDCTGQPIPPIEEP